MSELARIEKRLEASEQRLTELIQHLERQNSLEKSLDDAGRGIGEASRNLGELAASTKVALESLKSVVKSLQETVGILGLSNPAETAKAVARIEKALETARRETMEVVVKRLDTIRQESRNAIDKMSKQVSEAKEEFGAAVEEGYSATASKIEAILEKISNRQSESQNRAMLISYITLALVIIVFGIEAIRFFQ